MDDAGEPAPFRAKPRFSSVSSRARTLQFTDRRQFLEAFDATLKRLDGSAPSVLTFHGFGGIGKSTLLRELTRRAGDGVVVATVDFESAPLRHHEAALYVLRKQFGDAGAKFHHFDIAYAAYWQRMHPHIPLSEKSLPLIGDSEILSGILEGVSAVPMVGLVTNLAKAAEKLIRTGGRAYRIFEDADLRALDELTPGELLDALTFFFARDLRAASEKTRFIGIFDTYEALWYGVTTVGEARDRDSWIRDLASQTPGILWIIAGREEIRWADFDPQWTSPYLVRHRLDVLERADAIELLKKAGMDSPELIEHVVTASRGVPFYLSVALDHFRGVKEREKDVDLNEFGASHPEILDRFLRHLSRAQQELLKLLAVARYWDRRLFEALAIRFNIGVALTEFDEFCSYSFNTERRDGEWTMHDLMRDELVTRLNPDLLREVHSFIASHYRQLVDDSPIFSLERLRYFEEALWHAVRADGIDGLWLAETGDYFIRSGSWGPLDAIFSSIAEREDFKDLPQPMRAAIDLHRASLRLRRGVQDDAIDLLTCLKAEPEQPWLANVTLELAHARRQAGQPAEAAGLFALVHKGGLPGYKVERVALEARLWFADHLYYTGSLRDAWNLLEQVNLDPDGTAEDRANADRCCGHILRMVERREEALEYYERARTLFADSGASFGVVEADVGVLETLASLDPARAIAASDDVLDRLDALGSVIEKGKLFTALALAQLLLGRFEVAAAAARESASILQSVGYHSGVLRAGMVNCLVDAAEGKEEAAADRARTVIEGFSARGMYPMLAYLLGVLLEALESVTSDDRKRAAIIAGKIQWMDSEAETRRRYLGLIERCLHQSQQPL